MEDSGSRRVNDFKHNAWAPTDQPGRFRTEICLENVAVKA